MTKQFLKEGLGWGIILWAIGYVLGIIFFALVPQNLIGWIIMPIGTIITLWVLFKKIKGETLKYYFYIGLVWTAIAALFDYLFIVVAFKSAGYYKLDIYVYYALTFLLPVIAGMVKTGKKER